MEIRNIKKITGLTLLTVTLNSHAGFQQFTMHSRANCGGFNESISWHYKHTYWLLTNSVHVNPSKSWSCNLWSDYAVTATWRSAAYHWAEGYLLDKWEVYGTHYTSKDKGKSVIILAQTKATDCNIYNGWWDV